jgi:hypothetical protein
VIDHGSVGSGTRGGQDVRRWCERGGCGCVCCACQSLAVPWVVGGHLDARGLIWAEHAKLAADMGRACGARGETRCRGETHEGGRQLEVAEKRKTLNSGVRAARLGVGTGAAAEAVRTGVMDGAAVSTVKEAVDVPKDNGKKGLRVSGDVTADIMYYLQVTSMAEIRECFEDVRVLLCPRPHPTVAALRGAFAGAERGDGWADRWTRTA